MNYSYLGLRITTVDDYFHYKFSTTKDLLDAKNRKVVDLKIKKRKRRPNTCLTLNSEETKCHEVSLASLKAKVLNATKS